MGGTGAGDQRDTLKQALGRGRGRGTRRGRGRGNRQEQDSTPVTPLTPVTPRGRGRGRRGQRGRTGQDGERNRNIEMLAPAQVCMCVTSLTFVQSYRDV